MSLSAPTKLVFFISIIVAAFATLAALGVVAFIPISAVWIMAIAYVLLALGCYFCEV